MNSSTYKNFLIIRYSIYFLVAISIIISNISSLYDVPKLIFIFLLYIINTQLRIYFFENKKLIIITSLLIEMILISLLYYNFGGFTFVYYFIAILDATIMLSKPYSFIALLILYLGIIIESIHPNFTYLQIHPLTNVIFNTLIAIGFGSLGYYLSEEKLKKLEAEKLYDKIRISEENLKEAYERLEQYSNTIEEISILRERNRISKEIHDIIGHTLSTQIIQLQAIPFVMDKSTDDAKEMLNTMLQNSKIGLEDVRRAVRALSPTSFDNFNGIFAIKELLNNFEKNSKVKVNLSISKYQFELSSDQSFTLYRVIQETLNNAIRHGKASIINVTMTFNEEDIYIYIKDDGEGVLNINESFGINNMKERIKSIGGEINFHSSPSNGFETNIKVPRIENIAELKGGNSIE